jgi:hypothetical protein
MNLKLESSLDFFYPLAAFQQLAQAHSSFSTEAIELDPQGLACVTTFSKSVL